MKLRTLIFWPHLIAGVIAGTLVLTMSVTGVILTYERQLIAWSDSHLRSTPPSPGAPRLPVETILETIHREHPDLTVTALTIGAAPDAAAVAAAEGGNRHFDVYTGQLLGTGATGVRKFMSDLRTWHRYIGVAGDNRPIAKAVSGWANVLFLFIVASGIYLWFPRKWTWPQLRPVVWFKGGLRGKARDFNWHNAIGVWSAVPLFIVVASAVPISFRWASDAVYYAVGEQPPVPAARGGGAGARGEAGAGAREGRAGGRDAGAGRGAQARREPRGNEEAPSVAGLNALWTRAEAQVSGWRTINVRIPQSPKAPVVFAIDRGDGGQPHLRSTLTLERQTGEVVSYEDFASLTLGRRIRNVMRFAHTGEVLGIPGQTIAGLVSAGAVVLVWTGIALTLRRFNAWRGRRRDRRRNTADREVAA
jgi:uncharacterized iron-regulated membrane protein